MTSVAGHKLSLDTLAHMFRQYTDVAAVVFTEDKVRVVYPMRDNHLSANPATSST
jgi:hypothetical protein